MNTVTALPGARSTGPVVTAYRVDNAINLACTGHAASNGSGKHPGCGAAPGEYCVGRDGQPTRIPHTARLLHARDHLTDEQRARRDAESPTMRGGPNP